MARWFLLFLVMAAVIVAGLPQAASAAEPAMPVGVYLDGNVLGRDPAVCRAKLNEIKNKGFDGVQWANGWPVQQRACLNEADALGMQVIFFPADPLYDGWWRNTTVPVDLANAKRVAQPVIDELAQHPSIIGIQLADELTNTTVNKEKFKLMVAAWHELAPQWPVMASHNVTASWWPTYQLNASVDAFEAFNYPIRPSHAECAWLDRAISLHQSAQNGKPSGTPYYAILQAHGSDQFSLRTPTVPELRAQFFAALGSGASGYQWFIHEWGSGTDLRDTPTLYNEASDLGTRYRAIRANLDGLTPITNSMQSSNGAIKTFTLKANDRTFAVLLNTSCTASTRTTLSTSQAGVFTNFEDGLRGEKPVVDLRPGDGAVFEFVPASPAPSATPKPSPSPTPPAYCGYWWSRYVYPECK